MTILDENDSSDIFQASCITINTDASFKAGVCGYAFWITYDTDKRIFGANYHPERIDNNNEGEIIAIVNALESLLKKAAKIRSPWLIINTDSMIAINAIENPHLKGSKFSAKAAKLLKEVSTLLGATNVRLRHVKAHSGINSKRKYVNNWCDEKSKEYRLVGESNLKFKKK